MAHERTVDLTGAGTPAAARRRHRPKRSDTVLDTGSTSAFEGAHATPADVLNLQRRAGNQAVTALLVAPPVIQRDSATIRVTGMNTDISPSGPQAAQTPSDIDLGFNALDIAHRLIESIDQSQKKLLKKGDPG
jgi:hypothetical protein